MNLKYEFTGETVESFFGVTLFRIRAKRTFGVVASGDLGGFIESEENLSHSDNAWVSGNAEVSDDALVSDDAEVFWCSNIGTGRRYTLTAAKSSSGDVLISMGCFQGTLKEFEEKMALELEEGHFKEEMLALTAFVKLRMGA